MTVSTYLTEKASSAVLSTDEKYSIDTSISTLQTRLISYFQTGSITQHFKFGSSTRGTILPRTMDERSDIDYMVVFSDGQYKPQTYINWLKNFATSKYGTSEIYQSHPTVVLELNHIKFDLVPAIKNWLGDLQIPNGDNWIGTNPNDVNKSLEDKNKDTAYLIKPAIRLFKYWNAKAGYPFSSFESEKWILNQWFFNCKNLRDYLFDIFSKISTNASYANWINDEITRAKTIIAKVAQFEKDEMPFSAEQEMKRLFRE
jgi:Second Messenger Oligonucleotide or Dinucleotide Synthetase domain